VVRALVTERQRPGTVFVPMHWTDQFASAGRMDVLMGSDADPYSGQPALKMGEVSAAPALMRAYGFTVSRRRPLLTGLNYWAAAPVVGGHRLELAWAQPPEDWEAWVREAFLVPQDAPLLSSWDRRSGRCSFAHFDASGLDFATYFSPEPVAVSRLFVVTWLTAPVLDALRRSEVLAGRPGNDRPDTGPLVCACYSVGANTIAQAVKAGGCRSVEEVGTRLKAGTNCGSCRAEIGGIIKRLANAQPTPPSAPII
jgi:assimilatory nitrate reductase catalytic subunit